jgi:hypothetical protein
MPSWVTFDSNTMKVSGTAPLVDQNTDYTFYVESKWTDTQTVTVLKAITIQVGNIEIVENDENDEDNENDENDDATAAATVAATVAATSAQATLSAVAGFTVVNSLISKGSPSAMWSLENQLQIITLLMQIDPFTPKDFIEYLKGISFVNGNFEFIPFRNVPYLNWPAVKLDTELDDEKLNASGIHSQSTFVNLFSTIIVFIFAF